MTAAKIPPVMTTVPAVIRNPLHQQTGHAIKTKNRDTKKIDVLDAKNTALHIAKTDIYTVHILDKLPDMFIQD